MTSGKLTYNFFSALPHCLDLDLTRAHKEYLGLYYPELKQLQKFSSLVALDQMIFLYFAVKWFFNREIFLWDPQPTDRCFANESCSLAASMRVESFSERFANKYSIYSRY